MTETEIRNDWYAALNSVKNGTELSSIIHWGFFNQDLMILYFLHQANCFREKIEDLLEDCNFHTECELLAEGKYDECRNTIVKDMIDDYLDSKKGE